MKMAEQAIESLALVNQFLLDGDSRVFNGMPVLRKSENLQIW